MWPCAMSGEPVAVEVGEERLSLACVHVTVEHSSYKLTLRVSFAAFSPPRAAKTYAVNRKWWFSLLRKIHGALDGACAPTQHTFFLTTGARAARAHTHTHSVAPRATRCGTHAHRDRRAHTRQPAGDHICSTPSSALWLNCRVQRHAVGSQTLNRARRSSPIAIEVVATVCHA